MITVYWLSFGIGLAAIVVWILLRGLGEAEVLTKFDPEQRMPSAKFAIAALLGFGMAGLSSTYAGWATLWSLVAGVGGAIGAVLYARMVDSDDDREHRVAQTEFDSPPSADD